MKSYRTLNLTDGRSFRYYVSSSFTDIAEHLASANMPIGWEWDDLAPYDREFQEQVARYDSISYGEDEITLVTEDGKVIGALDAPIPAEFGQNGIKAENSNAS